MESLQILDSTTFGAAIRGGNVFDFVGPEGQNGV